MTEQSQPAPKELLYCWMSTTFEVLVPKKRGSGFVKVPFGHHANAPLDKIAYDSGTDVYGLDGSLSFQCGLGLCIDRKRRKVFEQKVIPQLEAYYGWKAREIRSDEFWELHPNPSSPSFTSGPTAG